MSLKCIKTNMSFPKYFTSKNLAGMFSVSPLTIKREYERGKLHGFYVGNELRYSQQDVDDYTCLREHQKTLREIELENKIKELEDDIKEKNSILNDIRIKLLEL